MGSQHLSPNVNPLQLRAANLARNHRTTRCRKYLFLKGSRTSCDVLLWRFLRKFWPENITSLDGMLPAEFKRQSACFGRIQETAKTYPRSNPILPTGYLPTAASKTVPIKTPGPTQRCKQEATLAIHTTPHPSLGDACQRQGCAANLRFAKRLINLHQCFCQTGCKRGI